LKINTHENPLEIPAYRKKVKSVSKRSSSIPKMVRKVDDNVIEKENYHDSEDKGANFNGLLLDEESKNNALKP